MLIWRARVLFEDFEAGNKLLELQGSFARIDCDFKLLIARSADVDADICEPIPQDTAGCVSCRDSTSRLLGDLQISLELAAMGMGSPWVVLASDMGAEGEQSM